MDSRCQNGVNRHTVAKRPVMGFQPWPARSAGMGPLIQPPGALSCSAAFGQCCQSGLNDHLPLSPRTLASPKKCPKFMLFLCDDPIAHDLPVRDKPCSRKIGHKNKVFLAISWKDHLFKVRKTTSRSQSSRSPVAGLQWFSAQQVHLCKCGGR